MGGCVFCSIAAGEAPAHRVYEDRATVAFMDVNPATDGHTLVVPRVHAEDLFGLGEDAAAAMWRTVRRVAGAIRRVTGCAGLNLLQANGRAAFQTVLHVHVHVVPRYVDDAIRLPWIPRPGDRQRISELAALIGAGLGEPPSSDGSTGA